MPGTAEGDGNEALKGTNTVPALMELMFCLGPENKQISEKWNKITAGCESMMKNTN